MNAEAVLEQVYEILNQNINIGVVILCLAIGFILKHVITGINNNWIPVILLVLGIIFAVIFDFSNIKTNTLNILITGIASGGIAIGIHQTGKTLFINNKGNAPACTVDESYEGGPPGDNNMEEENEKTESSDDSNSD